ncbi:SURF1 family protein [Candidatus Nitrosacidococcus tergens]|nr:SURF1 family protein [Candidatus Nitrosacidococcus tergens]
MITVLSSLGFWQLRRADLKRSIEIALKERGSDVPMLIGNNTLNQETDEYRKIIAEGYFDNQHTMLVDNQIYQGQVGYYILTPFLYKENKAILVNRGWIVANSDRQKLPPIESVDSSIITVHGTLYHPFKKPPFYLGKEEGWESSGWPKLIQYMNLEKLELELGYSLQPLIIQLDPNQPNGFARSWSSFLPEMGVQRHIAYAIQWFSMAFIAFGIFIALIKREINNQNQ